ncbi:MAG: hypothetical protein AMS18_00440 [Gemmatimonas sp. SG8_17]|nr:MAG: hypothetical protein AMS18_00440 [Gemmatimonas sp. SG8_17]
MQDPKKPKVNFISMSGGPNGFPLVRGPRGQTYEVLPYDFQGEVKQQEGVIPMSERNFMPPIDIQREMNQADMALYRMTGSRVKHAELDELNRRRNPMPDLSGLKEFPPAGTGEKLRSAIVGAIPEESRRGFAAFPRVASQEGLGGTIGGLIGTLGSEAKRKLFGFFSAMREGAGLVGEGAAELDALSQERAEFFGDTGSAKTEFDLSTFEGVVPHIRRRRQSEDELLSQ